MLKRLPDASNFTGKEKPTYRHAIPEIRCVPEIMKVTMRIQGTLNRAIELIRTSEFWNVLWASLAIILFALTTAAQQSPDYNRLERAADLIKQKQFAAAEAELKELLRVNRREPNSHNLLGVIRAQQQRPIEAERLFLQALKRSTAAGGSLS